MEVGSFAVQRYRKLPVEIDAIRYVGSNKREVIDFTGGTACSVTCSSDLLIPTLEGVHTASLGDFIIKGVKGEFYPCKPDVFGQTYALAKEATP